MENGRLFQHVCLGGTFDGIHNGHKVLLSLGCLMADKSLTVGVTDIEMCKTKKLWELIPPVEDRIKNVLSILHEFDAGTIEYKVASIKDPFGPSIEDPALECLIVSQETLRGGQKVNEKRLEKGMSELELMCIDLVYDSLKESPIEEDKISSSTHRIRSLGMLRKDPEPKPHLSPLPRIIGLTGGAASGKTSIMKYLEELGAAVIHSDLLAHETYASPESETYQAIVKHFGPSVLKEGPGSPIDRPALGRVVFNNPEKLQKLNSIVWPATRKLAFERIEDYRKQGRKVVFLESAMLLEAGWESYAHEIWCVIVDKEEAVRRIVTERNLSEDEARKRLEVQMGNVERVKHAHVVFCSAWEPSFTRSQVLKAWKGLMKRVET